MCRSAEHGWSLFYISMPECLFQCEVGKIQHSELLEFPQVWRWDGTPHSKVTGGLGISRRCAAEETLAAHLRQQRGVCVGYIFASLRGVRYHLCNRFRYCFQWAVEWTVLYRFFRAADHCEKWKDFPMSVSHLCVVLDFNLWSLLAR